MQIPHLHPEQYILFSNAGTSYGVGHIIPIQVQNILSWVNHNNQDEPYIEYATEGGVSYTIPYYDYFIMPPTYNQKNDDYQMELYKQTETYLNTLNK